MLRSTRNLMIVSLVLACLELTGCTYRSKKDTYYLVANNLKLPYWKAVQDGFNRAATEYGVTAYVIGPNGYDAAAEASAFSSAVARRPAGILVSAASAEDLQNDISTAIGEGVPVITVDSDAPNSQRLYFIGTNNLEAGHVGGQRLADQLHGKGNVVFYSIPGQPNLEERLKGYKDILADNPGIKIVDVVSTGGDSGSAFDRTEQFVGRHRRQKGRCIRLPGICFRQGSRRGTQTQKHHGSRADRNGCRSGNSRLHQAGRDRLDRIAEALHDGIRGPKGSRRGTPFAQ